MSIIQNRQEKFGLPGLFVLVGIGLIVGYSLHLAGFAGWMTLAVAGASLLAAGVLWRNRSGFSIFAIVVAIEGAILCTLALPGQLNNGENIAAVANLAIIAALIAAAAMIQRQSR
jgi:hypothetical protein